MSLFFVALICSLSASFAAQLPLCSDTAYVVASCTSQVFSTLCRGRSQPEVSVYWARPQAQCACGGSTITRSIPSFLRNSVQGSADTNCFPGYQLAPLASTDNIYNKYNQLVYAIQRCDTPQVCGDPHLVGFEGTKFEFSGYTGGYFNLISEHDHQLNVLLDDFGVMDATYIREIGFKYGDLLKLTIKGTRGKREEGASESVIEVNGEIVSVGNLSSVLVVGGAFITVSKTFDGGDVVQVKTQALDLTFERQHDAMHIDMTVNLLSPVDMHGVLGQTIHWSEDAHFLGDELDYVVSDLLADDFKFNMFQGTSPDVSGRQLLGLPMASNRMLHWRQ